MEQDNTKKGAFTFIVVLRDRFRNFIRVVEKDNEKHAKISVQYTPHDMPQFMRFLECSTTLRSNVDGDVYIISCAGAEKELIYFYPSINNVPLGGQDKYEARTTLCPGKSTCEGTSNYHRLFFWLKGAECRPMKTSRQLDTLAF